MTHSEAAPTERFQFRLWELFVVMFAAAVFFALVHYQSTLGLAILLAVACVTVARRRMPYRLNLMLVFGSASWLAAGFFLTWLGDAFDAHADATIFMSFGVLLIRSGALVLVSSVSFLVFMVWVIGFEAYASR